MLELEGPVSPPPLTPPPPPPPFPPPPRNLRSSLVRFEQEALLHFVIQIALITHNKKTIVILIMDVAIRQIAFCEQTVTFQLKNRNNKEASSYLPPWDLGTVWKRLKLSAEYFSDIFSSNMIPSHFRQVLKMTHVIVYFELHNSLPLPEEVSLPMSPSLLRFSVSPKNL